MAYYDALIAKWATAPAGTTQSKIDWINAQTVTGPARPMVVDTNQIYNKINRAEFTALTNILSKSIQDIIQVKGTMDMSPGTELRNQIMVVIFPAAKAPITNASLKAWMDTYDTPKIPWWSAPVPPGGGLSSPVSKADCDACVPPLM